MMVRKNIWGLRWGRKEVNGHLLRTCAKSTLLGLGGWVGQTESIKFLKGQGGPFPGLGHYFLICTTGREHLGQETRKGQLSVAAPELVSRSQVWRVG